MGAGFGSHLFLKKEKTMPLREPIDIIAIEPIKIEPTGDDLVDIYIATKPLEDAVFLSSISFKPNVTVEKLEAMDIFQTKVNDGKVLRKVRINNAYENQEADMASVAHATRFQRDYTPEIIEDIMNKRRCPADLHLYADDFGGEDVSD